MTKARRTLEFILIPPDRVENPLGSTLSYAKKRGGGVNYHILTQGTGVLLSGFPRFYGDGTSQLWIVVAIKAGMTTATSTAASIASIACFVAFAVKSPFMIFSIRFLRCFSSFLSKFTLSNPV